MVDAASSLSEAEELVQMPRVELANLVDRMIRRIWQEGHLCGFSDQEVSTILTEAQRILEPEPAFIRVPAPVVIFGDIHGQLSDLLKFFGVLGPPPDNKFLFLGDYVDRCKKSFEVIMLLLCYKIQFPHLIYLVRGNHECMKMNRIYGFYEELRRKRTIAVWKKFNDVFNELPLCALVAKKILCMHGGISPNIKSWNCLNTLKKPRSPRACDEGIALDLLWSDPALDGCCPTFQFNSNRATSVMFGEEAVKSLCDTLKISLILRAHEMIKEGHSWHFNHHLVTLFSAPNYCGTDGNCGSVMKVSKSLEVSFVTLRPIVERTILSPNQMKALQRQAALLAAKSPDPLAGHSNKEVITNESATNNTFNADKKPNTPIPEGPSMPELDLTAAAPTDSRHRFALNSTVEGTKSAAAQTQDKPETTSSDITPDGKTETVGVTGTSKLTATVPTNQLADQPSAANAKSNQMATPCEKAAVPADEPRTSGVVKNGEKEAGPTEKNDNPSSDSQQKKESSKE